MGKATSIPVPVAVPVGCRSGFNNGPGYVNGGSYRPYNNGGSQVRLNVRRVIY